MQSPDDFDCDAAKPPSFPGNAALECLRSPVLCPRAPTSPTDFVDLDPMRGIITRVHSCEQALTDLNDEISLAESWQIAFDRRLTELSCRMQSFLEDHRKYLARFANHDWDSQQEGCQSTIGERISALERGQKTVALSLGRALKSSLAAHQWQQDWAPFLEEFHKRERCRHNPPAPEWTDRASGHLSEFNEWKSRFEQQERRLTVLSDTVDAMAVDTVLTAFQDKSAPDRRDVVGPKHVSSLDGDVASNYLVVDVNASHENLVAMMATLSGRWGMQAKALSELQLNVKELQALLGHDRATQAQRTWDSSPSISVDSVQKKGVPDSGEQVRPTHLGFGELESPCWKELQGHSTRSHAFEKTQRLYCPSSRMDALQQLVQVLVEKSDLHLDPRVMDWSSRVNSYRREDITSFSEASDRIEALNRVVLVLVKHSELLWDDHRVAELVRQLNSVKADAAVVDARHHVEVLQEVVGSIVETSVAEVRQRTAALQDIYFASIRAADHELGHRARIINDQLNAQCHERIVTVEQREMRLDRARGASSERNIARPSQQILSIAERLASSDSQGQPIERLQQQFQSAFARSTASLPAPVESTRLIACVSETQASFNGALCKADAAARPQD